MRFMQIESVIQAKNRSEPAKNQFSVALLWVLIRIASPLRFYGGDSNEYPQRMFLWRNKQNYPLIITKYPPYLFH